VLDNWRLISTAAPSNSFRFATHSDRATLYHDGDATVRELERIGDQAVNIAHRAEELNREPLLKPLLDIPRMAEHAQGMIHDSLDAFVYANPIWRARSSSATRRSISSIANSTGS